MQKILTIFLSLMFLVCLVGCNDNELMKVKNSTKQEINKYVKLLDENNYTKDDWNRIIEIASNYISLIEGQDDINNVNDLKTNAIVEIDSVIPSTMTNEWIAKHFDLNDTEKVWSGNLDEEFNDNLIIVTLKKTLTYPVLELSCFDLENAIELEYIGGATPPSYFFKPEYKNLLEKYRQVLYIYVEPLGKEKIIESIRKLEMLTFVKKVSPNYIEYGI